jgi:hypothetical protein
MSMRWAFLLLFVSLPIAAQETPEPEAEEPEREWGDFPGQVEKPQERKPRPGSGEGWKPGVQPMPAYPYGYQPRPPPEVEQAPPEPPPEPNHVSMFGAHPLGKWVRGQSVTIGFPLVQIRLALGLHRLLDVSVGFDSFYGTLNEPRLGVRFTPLVGPHWALALQLEAGAAFFTARAQAEGYGPRWFTGRRNFNIQPGLLVSYQGSHPRSARLYLQAFYVLALDTEPYQRTPLGGTPLGVQPGHNAGLRLGTELPITSFTSLVFQLGADVHFRDGDSIVMPTAGFGLTTSI